MDGIYKTAVFRRYFVQQVLKNSWIKIKLPKISDKSLGPLDP